jgi:hypothetical protein
MILHLTLHIITLGIKLQNVNFGVYQHLVHSSVKDLQQICVSLLYVPYLMTSKQYSFQHSLLFGGCS